MRKWSSSRRKIMPLSASHNVAAEATNVASTASRSNADRLMTFSTLAVTACWHRPRSAPACTAQLLSLRDSCWRRPALGGVFAPGRRPAHARRAPPLGCAPTEKTSNNHSNNSPSLPNWEAPVQSVRRPPISSLLVKLRSPGAQAEIRFVLKSGCVSRVCKVRNLPISAVAGPFGTSIGTSPRIKIELSQWYLALPA